MEKFRVLVADAATSVRQFIKYTLEDYFPSADIEVASNGKNVQKRMEDSHFDLLIYDSGMPFLSGFELLEWLRKHETLKRTSFIMMSTTSDGESLKRAIHLGANGYLVKPLLKEHLVNKVKEIFSKYEKDSYDRRKSPRFRAEGGLLFQFDSQGSRGRLLNISISGALGLFDSKEPAPRILEKVAMTIEHDGKQTIQGLEGVVVRIQVVDTFVGPQQIQVAIKFTDTMNVESGRALSEMVSSLKQ